MYTFVIFGFGSSGGRVRPGGGRREHGPVRLAAAVRPADSPARARPAPSTRTEKVICAWYIRRASKETA